MKKKNTAVKIITTLLVSGASFSILKGCIEQNSNFDELSQFMLTNKINNKILKLPISENPIPVILNNLDEELKEKTVEAITALDEISENINYVILETDNTSITQKITISADKNLTEERGAGGYTNINYKEHTGEIMYPIQIFVDPDCANYYSSLTNENMLTTVVKHEMLHSLGFKDIYLEDEKYDTIMYYTMQDENRTLDYTEKDKQNIQRVYDAEKVNQSTEFCFYYKKEEEEQEI